MKILRIGDSGPSVAFLQLALTRAGYDPGGTDGVFGPRTRTALTGFQRSRGLTPDGVAGPLTHRALYPWYAGYAAHTVGRGDSLWAIARRYGATVGDIETANPGLDPMNLQVGAALTVPLPFDVTPTDIPYFAEMVDYIVAGLAARYPFIETGTYGESYMGKPLRYLKMGGGETRVLYNAEHHANEWITTPVLLKFAEELAAAYAAGGEVFGYDAAEILGKTQIYIAPAVNPDGLDLVTGELDSGEYYAYAQSLSENYPEIPFPSGWKANIRGVDTNLQYPANWEMAREIKFAQGFTMPGPRDFVGDAPLVAPESLAMYTFTKEIDPALILAYHTQGGIIYWKYLDFEPPRSREIAQAFGEASGYEVEETPYASGFAGYKDWFIQDYDRPGYTIEAGRGENPLPLSQFDEIYADNLGILTLGAELISP